MKNKITYRRTIIGMLVTALSCSSVPCGMAADAARKKVVDVALMSEGVLQGQLVNQSGIAQANKAVTIRSSTGIVARARTDANGQFSAKLPRGDMYAVHYGQNSVTFRAWAHKTAPPAAGNGVLLVSTGQPTVLGQGRGSGGLLLFGGIAAAGLAVGISEGTDGS